ncbi:helix-turn-helix domain-containing protein [Rugosimonospora acidiphila]|uniref:Helix-turn-helix domain-containing protein n=1 Tax=Rugosimonospora acidiphila TaxID=556531 RepID=A0ABP9SDT0_9ACTN
MRNRDKILDTARELFAAEGLTVPMDRIASAAGVGPGTLYRHFPSRDQLWEAVLEQPLLTQLELAERAVANPDRWAGVADYLMATCALEAERGGYLNLMTTPYDRAPRLLAIRAQIQRRIEELFDSARDSGAIRADFTVEDLIFIMLSNGRVAEVTRAIAPRAWRRNVELFLDSIRPERAHPLSQPAMRPGQVYRTMTQSSARHPSARSRDAAERDSG